MPPVPTHANPIIHEGTVGGIRHSPASAYAQELATWETQPLEDGSVTQGMINAARASGRHHGVFEHQEFPKMLYQFEQTKTGIKPVLFVVNSDHEQRNMESRGWHVRQEDAMDAFEKAATELARVAANRAYNDRRMTPRAQEEADRIDSSAARHLGEIPAKPIVKRRPYTRKPKPPVGVE
jgi:hypothetical protein